MTVTLPRFLRRLFRFPGPHGDLDEAGRDQNWRRGFADGRLAERAGAGPLPEEPAPTAMDALERIDP